MGSERTEGSACDVGEEDGSQQEEQKMEQFFALIRSFREARNRRKDELEETKEKEKKKLRMSVREEGQSGWVPRFEWEDFTEEIEFRRPPMILPSPCNKKEDEKKRKKQQQHVALDLNLAL